MTKFSDMPIGSRNGWVLWAQSHDWGAGDPFIPWYDDMTGELVTYCWVSERNGSGYVEEARHSTPKEMKDWAGY